MLNTTASRKLDVSARSDTAPCDITGGCYVPDNYLALVDHANNKMKIFNISEQCLQSVFSFTKSPWDVTLITNEDRLAVTVPKQGTIFLFALSLHRNVIVDQQLNVGLHCRGIAYSQGCLIVSFGCTQTGAKGCLKIMHTNGLVLHIFETDDIGRPLFESPSHLAVDSRRNIIYVVDFGTASVSILELDGTIAAVMKDRNIKDPRGIEVDSKGRVFLCEFDSSCIQLITNDLRKSEIFADRRQGVMYPRSAFCDDKDNLYVTMFYNRFVNILNQYEQPLEHERNIGLS